MKTIRFLIIPILAIGTLTISTEAQRQRTPVRRPTTATKKPVTPIKPALTSEVILAKQKVSDQLFNINLFVDKLGPIALGIESVDADAKSKKLKKETIDANNVNKQKVIQAIRNFKMGLANLETDFRTKPDLKKYLTSIQGISDLCAQSEDSAIAGKFVAAKTPLRGISKKLSDTLALMP